MTASGFWTPAALAAALFLAAAGGAPAQNPAPAQPPRAAVADSSSTMAVLHGRAAAERVGTGGSFAGGFVGGFFLGLIGTGIAYAVASGSDAQLPALDAARLAQATSDYQLAFRQGFEERVRARRKGAALTGGLLGTATIVVLVLSAAGGVEGAVMDLAEEEAVRQLRHCARSEDADAKPGAVRAVRPASAAGPATQRP